MAEGGIFSRITEYLESNSGQIKEQLDQYSYLVVDSLFVILAGMVTVFLLHKLASKLIYPRVKNTRLLSVTFGMFYVLVLVVAVIMVLAKVGFDVSTGGSIAILAVLFLTVVVYFILPFIPKLPFMPGHTIVAYGEMGTVDQISTFHTTLRKFDGTVVFLPNAMVMASKILNYSYVPNRRIEMSMKVAPGSNLDTVRERLLAIAANEHRVLADPAPAVFVMSADAGGIDITLYCWVENADFLGTRSDLWIELMKLADEDAAVSLSPELQAIKLQEPQ